MYTLIRESSFLSCSAMQNCFGNWGNESRAASSSVGPLKIDLDGNDGGIEEERGGISGGLRLGGVSGATS